MSSSSTLDEKPPSLSRFYQQIGTLSLTRSTRYNRASKLNDVLNNEKNEDTNSQASLSEMVCSLLPTSRLDLLKSIQEKWSCSLIATIRNKAQQTVESSQEVSSNSKDGGEPPTKRFCSSIERRSIWWSLFSETKDPNRHQCSCCNSIISQSPDHTSNLLSHWRLQHANFFSLIQNDKRNCIDKATTILKIQKRISSHPSILNYIHSRSANASSSFTHDKPLSVQEIQLKRDILF
jgi:hypothetical protein